MSDFSNCPACKQGLSSDVPTSYELAQATDDIMEVLAGPYSADAEEAHRRDVLRLLGMLAKLDEDTARDVPGRTLSAVGLHPDDVERELTAVFQSVELVKVAKVEAPAGSIEAQFSHTVEVKYRHAGLPCADRDIAPSGWIIEPGRKARALYGRDVSGRWSLWAS